jgi:hypothetical protein
MKTPGCDDEASAASHPAEQDRLTQLLSASPAVIYGYRASGDFAPTYVSDNIRRVFGYEAEEYLKDSNFWRDRVHPDELPAVEAEALHLFRRAIIRPNTAS